MNFNHGTYEKSSVSTENDFSYPGLQATPDVVNVKAKTHEKVDSLGENRSIACHSVVLLVRK